MLFSSTGAAQPLAYVPNEQSGTLSVIDTRLDRVIDELPAGSEPRGVAILGERIYVTDQRKNALHVIHAGRRAIERTIALGESPGGVSLSPDGKTVAVASELANSVALVDAAAGRVLATVKTEGRNPEHAVFSPDGRWLYVSAEDASQVDVIEVANKRQVRSIPVGKRPRGIAFTPDGTRAYVACELADTVYAIDVKTHSVIAPIPAGSFSNVM
jgi:YVTN family beta-propeller protein